MEPCVIGIDEAGRGSILGSMFIAGFAIESQNVNSLLKLGVRDSKSFTSNKERGLREELAKKLESMGKIFLYEVTAPEIDQALIDKKDNLNLLEIRYFASIILEASKSTILKSIFLDAISTPDYSKQKLTHVLKERFDSSMFKINSNKGKILSYIINNSQVEIIAENKADSLYLPVAAASIVAKTARENSLRQIEEQYDFEKRSLGAGYPNENDSRLMTFLESHSMEIKSRKYPFVRYSWKWKNFTWQKLVPDHKRVESKQISEFFRLE
ncbi:MAG: ribonuclease HII [Candidatus Hodarchaeales archaeon]